MGVTADQEYCAFQKAIEHFGERWSLLILAELVLEGPRGFNGLAAAIPGHISRSVLTERLRKLEELGLIAGERRSNGRVAGYRATPAGLQLEPVLRGLWDWAERWVPEDPAVAERDPDMISWWLTQRVAIDESPQQPVVIDLLIAGGRANHCWLVLRRGAEPSMCFEDPLLDPARYLYVRADAAALLPVARGLRSWASATADRSIEVDGEPALVRALPGWFIPTGAAGRSLAGPRAVA